MLSYSGTCWCNEESGWSMLLQARQRKTRTLAARDQTETMGAGRKLAMKGYITSTVVLYTG